MISVIGAGPAGSYLSYLLAKKGHEVNLFEEHGKPGKPVQCSGILASKVNGIINVKKDLIVNVIKKARIIAPNKEFIEINFSSEKENLILDRGKFDEYLFNLARDNGVNVFLNHRFNGFSEDNTLNFDQGSYKTDILVGADGPFSKVAKSAGLYNNRKFLQGVQARVEMPVDRNRIDMFLNVGEFAWIVPESDHIARVGVVHKTDAAKHFKEFVKDNKILEYQSGIIPLYSPFQKTQKDNIYLIGDAATMVKPLTYGGILQGMKAAEIFVEDMKNYEKNWKKQIGRELLTGLLVRYKINRFRDEDYNKLIKAFQKEKLTKLLAEIDRDHPKKILIRSMFQEPRLLKFVF